MKITKKLIKEIIQLHNSTLQDIEVLKDYISLCLHSKYDDKLYYEAIKKYNLWSDRHE